MSATTSATAADQAKHIDFTSLVADGRVHGSIYTKPAIFDAEMDRIFHHGWVYVGHESEVPNPGDFRLRPIGRQPTIMVRGDDRMVRVLMNRCPHRGTQVCVEESGTAKLFACAYHGWSFTNAGRLAGVPGRERYGKTFRVEDFGLRPAPRVSSYRGLVFASLCADGETLDEHLGPLAKSEIDIAFDLSPTGQLDLNAGVHKFGYCGNWKLQLENSVDGYHVNYLHRAHLQVMAKRTGRGSAAIGTRESPARTRSLGHGHVAWDFRPVNRAVKRNVSNASTALGWRANYERSLATAHGERRANDLLLAGLGHVLIFPNLILIASQIRVVRPLAVNRTEVFMFPTKLVGAPDELNQERLRLHESFYGPAGGGSTDDLEVFDRITVGLRAEVDPWIDVSRGLDQQTIDPDGAVVCNITDELGSRAILHHWRDVVSHSPARSGAASLPESNGQRYVV